MASEVTITITPTEEEETPIKLLNKVYINSDVYATCIQHALSTEKEEIMGMLIGEIDHEECVSYILESIILTRSDKQPDRVEVSPEQLCLASAYAEKMALKLDRPIRVVGWYHSHPKITVWPSHVDLGTQQTYQMMDSLFVGLIFATFQNTETGNKIHVICFQAVPTVPKSVYRKEVELVIANVGYQKSSLRTIASLPRILAEEEVQRREKDTDVDYNDVVAGIHNDALQALVLSDVATKVAGPLYEDLKARLECAMVRINMLEDVKMSLMKKDASD